MGQKEEIRAKIVLSGMTMKEVVEKLVTQYQWSDSTSNFSNKLTRESIRLREAEELADVLGYRLEWVKKEQD